MSLRTQLSFSETQSLLKLLRRCGVTNSQTQLTLIFMILLSHLTPDPYGPKTVRAVSRQTEISSSPPPRRTLLRHISVSRWYELLSRVGLNYGPEFQGLTSTGLTRVTSSTTHCSDAAKVLNARTCQEEPFLSHPAATTDVFCTVCP
jgi:hypothetical protein